MDQLASPFEIHGHSLKKPLKFHLSPAKQKDCLLNFLLKYKGEQKVGSLPSDTRKHMPTLFLQLTRYLKDMKGFKLNVGTFISKEVHHQFEVLWLADVLRHNRKVMSVQDQLPQQLKKKKNPTEIKAIICLGAIFSLKNKI